MSKENANSPIQLVDSMSTSIPCSHGADIVEPLPEACVQRVKKVIRLQSLGEPPKELWVKRQYEYDTVM